MSLLSQSLGFAQQTYIKKWDRVRRGDMKMKEQYPKIKLVREDTASCRGRRISSGAVSKQEEPRSMDVWFVQVGRGQAEHEWGFLWQLYGGSMRQSWASGFLQEFGDKEVT